MSFYIKLEALFYVFASLRCKYWMKFLSYIQMWKGQNLSM